MKFYVRALSYFRKDGRWITCLLALIALSMGLELLGVWTVPTLIDGVLTTTPRVNFWERLFLAPLPSSRLGQVIGITLIGMFLKISMDSISMLRNMINNLLRYHGAARGRRELFDKLQQLGPSYHKSHPQGDALYRLSNDTLGLFGILDTFIATSVSGVKLAVMVLIMVQRNVPLTIFALAITPLMIWTNLRFGARIKRRAAESKQIETDFLTLSQRAMAAMGLIQAFGRQKREARRFDHAVDRCTTGWLRLNWQEQLYPLVVNIIYALGGAIIFGYGGYLVYRDQFVHPVHHPVTIGDLMAFMGYLGQLWDPLRTLTGFSATIQAHAAATERVFYVLDVPQDIHEAPNAIHLPVRPRSIMLDEVEFAYGTTPVLRGVTARILPGQMVAFVGPSGAGKSTLLNLFMRFYDPSGGAVRLDGIDVRSIRLADLRKHIALVPQDSMILPMTVASNIAYGRPSATEEEIRAAAELASADAFIEELPHGYQTELSEGGGNLSGGQRQRIAIARALLSEAPILVLDEPTSALDPTQESMIIETLHHLRGRRTIILVTHHLRSVEQADRIYVLDAGQVVEQGTHNSLMAEEGLYAQLARQESSQESIPFAA